MISRTATEAVPPMKNETSSRSQTKGRFEQSTNQIFDSRYHALRRNAKLRHHFPSGSAHAKTIDTDNLTVKTDETRPESRHTRFNGNSLPAGSRQHLFLVALVLAQKTLGAGH